MDEIAATMSAAGLPAGFHEAAAALYRRVPRPPGGDVAGSDQTDGSSDSRRTGDPAVEQILALLTSPATTAKAPPRG
jgi:hypothetical protein